MIRESKWASLTVLCICQVAVMALWFSASAVVPSLTAEYGLSGIMQSLWTSSVQAGFGVGSLTSAAFGLADRLDPRHFFMAAALIAALANSAVLLIEPTSLWVLLLRFITGACMAGIYPVGTMLTLQTALGFTLALVTIHLMPLWIDWLGWRLLFCEQVKVGGE